MSEINESNLKKFLQDHSPKAPPPPKNELTRIQSQLRIDTSSDQSFVFYGFKIASALAASMVAVWFLNTFIANLNENPISPSIVKTQQELMLENSSDPSIATSQIPMHGANSRLVDVQQTDALPSDLESADVDLMMEEWPTMDIGEDYLAWASL